MHARAAAAAGDMDACDCWPRLCAASALQQQRSGEVVSGARPLQPTLAAGCRTSGMAQTTKGIISTNWCCPCNTVGRCLTQWIQDRINLGIRYIDAVYK